MINELLIYFISWYNFVCCLELSKIQSRMFMTKLCMQYT